MEVITGLTGCKSRAELVSLAEQALEQKYHESFEVTEMKSGILLTDYYSFKAYAEDYPDLLFQGSMDDKNFQISDSYCAKRFCARLSEKMSRNMGQIESEFFVYTELFLSDLPISNPDISLEEFKKEYPALDFTIYVFLNSENEKYDSLKAQDQLSHLLDGIEGIDGMLAVYEVNTEKMKKVQEYLSTSDNTYQDFDDMTIKDTVFSVEFTNSQFSIPQGVM